MADLSSILQSAVIPPREEMERMPHAALYNLRAALPTAEQQNEVSPFEHRAFARELTKDRPYMALPLAVSIPAYQVAKMLPKSLTGNQSRSDPSLEQVKQGYSGIADGIAQLLGIR